MKNYFLLSLVFILFLVSACKTEECEENNTGTLTLVNDRTVQIEVDVEDVGTYTIEPGEEVTVTVDARQHSADVTILESLPYTLGIGFDVAACQPQELSL